MSERNIRINKVLRELNISLERAVNFLKDNDFLVENNPNTKINQEECDFLTNQFSLKKKTDKIAGNLVSSSINEAANIVIVPQNITAKSQVNVIKNNNGHFTPGKLVTVKIARIVAPSQIITEYIQGYMGRLSLVDIAWSFPESEMMFKKYKIGDALECSILSVDERSKQIKLGQKDLAKPLAQTVKWDRLERGEEFDAQVIQHLHSIYLVQTKNKLFGVVRKALINDPLKDLRLKINAKFEESSLLDFIPSDQEQFENFEIEEQNKDHLNFIEEELQSFSKFKKTLLSQKAKDEQIQKIKNGFDLDINIFSKEIDTSITLYIQFLMSDGSYENTFKNQAIPYFLEGESYSELNEKKVLDKLSNEKYWFIIYKEKNLGKKDKDTIEVVKFSLYNNEINFYGEVNISKDKKDVRFLIRNFSFGQNFPAAAHAKKNYAKDGSFLFSNKLKITSPLEALPFDNSQKEFLNYSLTKIECFEIIEQLKKDTSEILRQEGSTLEIIDKFLEYQINLLAGEKENNMFVETFEKINSSFGGISIRLPRETGDKLELEDGTILNVRLYEKEKLSKLSDGFITIQEGNYILNFNRDILVDLLTNGFYIDKRVSTRQFDIQREIIKDFLDKKIKIDHIESLLVNPSKVRTPILKSINFKNGDLLRTEIEQPDNIQVKAVKKAVGNQNIFLVQGPPGTGKTTVIAEIIEQLTANNEKILVSGQNHVAVDNVLEKIAKNPNLNLLRVGNPERIDKNLSKYCYENLVEEYKIDYKRFIKNQKVLTQAYLEFTRMNLDKKTILERFNKKVIELQEYYIYLKETFKQKHFILRESISDLSENEILQTIDALSNWENSFSNEYEILLQPIIYNSVDVVFATCIGIKSDKIFKESNFKFDTVIIDEAGKANIAETLVAIELGKKVILVGDQMQLPPYMDSSLIDKDDPKSFPNSIYGKDYHPEKIIEALKTSFFEFLIGKIEKKQFPSENKEMLNYQHRMHPNIGNFISESFYGSKVFMGSRTHLNRIDMEYPFNKEIVFFDTSNSKNPFEQKEGSSVKNDTEAETIAEFILPELFANNIKTDDIAIIAPYKFQVSNIEEYIKKSTICQNKNIDVATLDSFQGKEYDIIIFSFTRSTDHNKVKSIDRKKKYLKVGFLDDARRLNVAFSRAKKKLILVGNATTLADPRSHFDGIFNYTKLFKKLVHLSQNKEIGNFMNITDYHTVLLPFEKIRKKYDIGDTVTAKFKSLGNNKDVFFGAFFYVDGFECLLPASFMSAQFKNSVKSMDIDHELDLIIYSFDRENKRITLNSQKAEKKYKSLTVKQNWCKKESVAEKRKRIWSEIKDDLVIGRKIKGKVVNQTNFGFFIKLENEYEALLHNKKIPKNKNLKLNDFIDAEILEIDYTKQQISLTL